MPTKLSRYCEGIMEAAWLAAVILIPIFFNTYSARIFEPDKITLERSLAILILAAWMVKLIDQGAFRWERLPKGHSIWDGLRRIPMLVPALIIALVYMVSTLFSVAPQTSLWGSYQRLQGTYTMISYLVIFAAILGNLRRKAQVERIIISIILTSLPISLYGILQRLKVDPIPWGADVSVRVAANLGNSIFVAAYLIMAFPLTVGKIVETFDAILKENSRLPAHIARGTVYVFIAAVQLVTIYLSGSRGPFLGWLASMFFLALLLSLHWRKRWMLYSMIVVAVLGSTFLLLLNVKNGPLEAIRRSPAVGRLGGMLDSDSTNALVRKYIWEGAAYIVTPHDPIVFPDGSQDTYNILRPLIGYGPESMYVAYNPFYPPQLGQVEKRNASPDRSHNETWDSLVTTGILGFGAYLLVFMTVFYYGLKWLGMIHDRRQKILFFAFSFGGGVIGAALLILWGGVEFFGVGLPFGIAIGVTLYLTLVATASKHETPQTPGESARSLTLIVLFAAILAHFLEINFGIAIAATRTYFWIFSALIVLVGYILPLHNQYGMDNSEASQVENVKADGLESKGARSKRRKEKVTRLPAEWKYREFAANGLLLGLILVGLNYDFILNQVGLTSPIKIFWTSLTQLPDVNNTLFFGVLLLMATTWLFGSVVLVSESSRTKDFRSWLAAWGTVLGISAAIGIFMGLIQSGLLAGFAAIAPTNLDELLQKVDAIGGVLTHFYFWVFLIIFALGLILLRESQILPQSGTRWGWISVPVFLGLFIAATSNSNLRIIQADIAFKMADPFTTQDQWLLASALYNHAIEQAPNEDYYYLFLGRSYLEEAKTIEDAASQEQFVTHAEEDLQTAQKINPLNTDHTANLARLYSWWASRTSDPTQRKERGEKASDYYRIAVTLSPNNSTLWGEWAILLLDMLEKPEEARQKLDYALNLDPSYSFTQGLMGDYYVKLSRSETVFETRVKALQTAQGYYQEAVRVAKPAEKTMKINYLVSLGNSYIEQASLGGDKLDPALLQQAVGAYQEAVSVGPAKSDLARIEMQIARLYIELGDRENARAHVMNAQQLASTDQQEELNQLLSQIESMP